MREAGCHKSVGAQTVGVLCEFDEEEELKRKGRGLDSQSAAVGGESVAEKLAS